MNRNLIIFGDSFSTNFTSTNEVNIQESWPVLLSKKLNYNLINHAIIGASNGEIINKFFEKYKDINSNDLVILEIGFYNRILDQFKNTTVAIDYDTRFSKIEMDFFKYKSLDLDEYITQDLIKFAFICDYLKKIGVNFLIWCIDRDLDKVKESRGYAHFFYHLRDSMFDNFILFNDKFSCMDEFINPNEKYWCHEGDKHFNKIAHSDFFQYLYEYIQLKKYEI